MGAREVEAGVRTSKKSKSTKSSATKAVALVSTCEKKERTTPDKHDKSYVYVREEDTEKDNASLQG